jgi:hypothetical protein
MRTLRTLHVDRGLLTTLAASVIFLFLFYSRVLLHPATTLFSEDGDGIQTYFATAWHVQHDRSWFHQSQLNYPYGESIYYTGANVIIANGLRLLGVQSPRAAVALINLSVVLSLLLAALFLYLVFRDLRLPPVYGALAGTGIAFLAPQVHRLLGHLNLAYAFALPACLWLLMRFYTRPTWMVSIAVGALLGLMSQAHLYFFGLLGGLVVCAWMALFARRDRGFGHMAFALKHVFVQLIAPFVLVQLVVRLTDPVTDRTAYPWGFLVYRSSWSGVLFPWGSSYQEPALRLFPFVQLPVWEGRSHIGLAADLGLVVLMAVFLVRMSRRRWWDAITVTDSRPLNVLFWSSLVILLYSFGYPFRLNPYWLHYSGPLRQMRGIGRFAWVFFFVVNIVVVYRVYQLVAGKRLLRWAVCPLLLGMLFLDAYDRNAPIHQYADTALFGSRTTDSWVRGIDVKRYQALITLPYYHLGSENLYCARVRPEPHAVGFRVAMRTGLPLMPVSASRTSLGQSVRSIGLVLEPVAEFAILRDFPDPRPLLALVWPTMTSASERQLAMLGREVAAGDGYQVREITLEALRLYSSHSRSRAEAAFPSRPPAATGEVVVDARGDPSIAPIYHDTFDDRGTTPGLSGRALHVRARSTTTLMDQYFAVDAPLTLLVSFWVRDIGEDLHGRTLVIVSVHDRPESTSSGAESFVGDHVVMLRDGWGLVETAVTVRPGASTVRVQLHNPEMRRRDRLTVDELLVRPEGTTVWGKAANTIIKNNRRY